MRRASLRLAAACLASCLAACASEFPVRHAPGPMSATGGSGGGRAQLLSALGISRLMYVTSIPSPRLGTTDSPEEGAQYYAKQPSRGMTYSLSYPPGTHGYRLELSDGPLMEAGFRTGDVLTGVDDASAVAIQGELEECVERGFAQRGFVVLRIQHFTDEYWNRVRRKAFEVLHRSGTVRGQVETQSDSEDRLVIVLGL